MISLRYHLLDVFAEEVFGGNQLAVFPEADGLSDQRMQAIARELNLSETTFVHTTETPGADCRVRIFTPAMELPMAGHPTVGTAYVLAGAGGQGDGQPRVFHLEESVGVLRVEVNFAGGEPDLIFMNQPLPRFDESPISRPDLARLLGLDEQALDPALPVEIGSAGVPFHLIPVGDRQALAAARLDQQRWAERLADSPGPHVYVFHRDPESPDTLFARMFAPAMAIPEDPATGAAAGPVAAYAVRHWPGAIERPDSATRVTIRQGIEMGRPSLIDARVEHEGDRIESVKVGGRCKPVGSGELVLPPETT